MALYPTSDAEPIYDDASTLIGYVRQHTPELWLPLDTNGENIGAPTYKPDAQTIVALAAAGKI